MYLPGRITKNGHDHGLDVGVLHYATANDYFRPSHTNYVDNHRPPCPSNAGMPHASVSGGFSDEGRLSGEPLGSDPKDKRRGLYTCFLPPCLQFHSTFPTPPLRYDIVTGRRWIVGQENNKLGIFYSTLKSGTCGYLIEYDSQRRLVLQARGIIVRLSVSALSEAF